MSLVTPHTFTAGESPTSAAMQTLTDSISQLQGGAPSSGALDFCTLAQIVTQNIGTGVWTGITFTSEGVDSAGGHSTSSNTSRYVAAHSGWYDVSAGVAFAVNATGVRGARLAVNGTGLVGKTLIPNAGASNTTEVPLSRKVYLAAGSYLEVQGYQNSGGTLATSYTAGDAGSFLELRWIHS